MAAVATNAVAAVWIQAVYLDSLTYRSCSGMDDETKRDNKSTWE